MKKVLVLAVGLLVFGLSGTVFGSEGVLDKLDVEVSGTVDFYSQYIWRGFALDTDPVIQPGFSLSKYGFTLSWWGSFDVDNNDSLNSDESDVIIDYTKEFDNFSLSLGHTYYDFPGTGSYSREFYAGFALPDFFLSPSLTYYHDYGDEDNGGGDGDYLVLDVSKSFTVVDDPEITLDLGAHLAYNNELFIAGEGGDCLFSAGLTIPLKENLTFSPSINYSVPFGDLEDTNDGNQKERFYAGFSLGYAF